jgi:hypothetical protein
MQQGEEVWVKNDANIGVTFTFSLTKYKNSRNRQNL